jgi:hypothetical protein
VKRKSNLDLPLLLICIALFQSFSSGQPVRSNPESSRCISDAEIRLTAAPASITVGQSSTLSWNVSLPAGCGAIRIRLNDDDVPRSGSRSVSPAQSSAFRLTVRDPRGRSTAQATQSARVEILYPPRILIDRTTREPVQVLIGALESTDPIVVELCNVDLDLTGQSLTIGSDKSLIGSPGCERSPRRLGPRIFATDGRGLRKPLFAIRGDNVVFSGFRLEGPTNGIGSGDGRLERGIYVWPFESAAPIGRIEISNMEIFHWSGAGVDIRDNTVQAERGRLFNTNIGAVHVVNNYIHHNRHDSGNGYGVEVATGAYALIERNVFDENRHAIAGGSSDKKKDFTGYTLRDNLILAGGGRHCNDNGWWALLGWTNLRCWQTHQVDMHGDKNEWYSDSNWCCGIAGETMIIERNTILYTSGNAIKIRGNPADKAVVDGNVFKHASRSGAITQNGDTDGNITKPIDIRPNNVFGSDPLASLGSCDLVGDGIADQFMATGVTWWAKSPVTEQWRYLNTMPERLQQIVLVNVDNDGRCDVAIPPPSRAVPPRRYSKNGTGPWVQVSIFEQ